MNIAFFFIFSINKNIIQIYNNKDIKFFYKDLIDIVLKSYQNISQLKKHYLILKMTIFNLESYFSLIFFANSYPMISIYEIKQDKSPSLSQSI